MRALASHQCAPGSISGPGVVCGLSLCWFSTLLRGFFSGYSGFPYSSWLLAVLQGHHGPCNGCQRRLNMLSVRHCRAASLLYLRGRLARQLYISYRTKKGNLSKYQNILSLTTTSFLLITSMFDQVVII